FPSLPARRFPRSTRLDGRGRRWRRGRTGNKTSPGSCASRACAPNRGSAGWNRASGCSAPGRRRISPAPAAPPSPRAWSFPVPLNGYDSRSMKIKIQRLSERAILPAYAHSAEEDAGLDLHALEDATLEPGIPRLVPTGLRIEVPPGYEAQIRPRSGLALHHAITLPNSPATIDPGYRGELKVILLNLGRADYQVHSGDRIAQMVLARYEPVDWEESELSESVRGAGGFGSSGR